MKKKRVFEVARKKPETWFRACNLWDVLYTRPQIKSYLDENTDDIQKRRMHILRLKSLGYWNVLAKTKKQVTGLRYIPNQRVMKIRRKFER
jgi:hypothetical protein